MAERSDRIQDIIDSVFTNHDLRKRAETAAPVDLADATKVVVTAPGGIKQPPFSTGRGGGQSESNPRTKQQERLDRLQLGLDAVGIFEPTPFADGTNAAISLGRAAAEPDRRGEHLKNAAISAVSMIPYVGDLAKLAKVPGAARTIKGIGHAGEAARGMREDRFQDGLVRESAGGRDGGGVPPTLPPASHAAEDDPESQREANDELDRWTDKLKKSGESIISVFGPLGKLVVGTTAAIKSLELLNTGVIAVNRDLADFNGGLASSYAEFEADEVRRKIRKGQTIDGPTGRLLEEQSELRDHIERFTSPIQAGMTQGLVYLTQIANAGLAVIEAIPGISHALEFIERKLKEDANERQTAWEQLLKDIADGKLDGPEPVFEDERKPKETPSAADIVFRSGGIY